MGQTAICLVKIRDDYWLLTTIDTVVEELGVTNGINYIGSPLNEYKKFFGRTIIRYHKSFHAQGVNYTTIADELEVSQILPDTFDDDFFPGYDNVCLTYMELKSILDRGKKDWIGALENQKAVYLITDNETGQMYVGSATSDNGMLLQRWQNYIKNGHGNNKELKKLDFEHIQNCFSYSILENYNAKTDDSVILEREQWWKKVLQTRKFGYNDN